MITKNKDKPGRNWYFTASGESRRDRVTFASRRYPRNLRGTRGISVKHDTEFDELVVGEWLHIEQMDSGTWCMRLGDAEIIIKVDRNDNAELKITRTAFENGTKRRVLV